MAARKKPKTSPELTSQADPRAPLAFDAFLSAAQRVLKSLAEDLLARADASPGVTSALKARWSAEQDAKRTADVYDVYRRRVVGQVAAAWLLSLVFVRTLEDRGLVERARIAGPGALDSQRQFFELAPYLTERDYLLTVFRELSNLDAARDLFDPSHDLLWKLAPSVEGARALLDLFRAPHADAPTHRFGQSDTRFLGDLYQLLDEDVRERFALLQTPRFVESFILDRTLERSVVELGLDATTMIDPTCGSGHFLLGAFDRLFDHQLRQNPSLDVRKAVERALAAVHGVDLNPYAVAVARFRLTLAALEKGGWEKIESAPRLPLNLVVADSLLHRVAAGQTTFADRADQSATVWKGEQFALDDEAGAKRLLAKRYAVVVGNPPYITVKDAALRETYRAMYPRSAAGKYSLGAPFTERFFDLARERGFVGMITANSFMKREFGKRLIEDYLRSVNLELIVNTSGAYIPGHGTPTVLLFGRNERPAGGKVLAVLAKRGEPTTPADPEQGLVWRSVADHFAEVGFENEYVSVAELERATIERHPWSLGGGGAAELKELLEERGVHRLREVAAAIGVMAVTGEDELFVSENRRTWHRLGIADGSIREFGIGENMRDWSGQYLAALYPHEGRGRYVPIPTAERLLWIFRVPLRNRIFFGKTPEERGLNWREYAAVQKDKLQTPLTIAFAFVATHNHFVLDRGGTVFNRTAPVIKLPEGATEDDHLALLGYLNTSVAAFYLRQAGHSKGAQGVNEGHKAEVWEQFLEYSGTLVGSVPVPAAIAGITRVVERIRHFAQMRAAVSPPDVLARLDAAVTPALLREQADLLLARMCGLQEELDWMVYESFGLLTDEQRTTLRHLRDEVMPGFPDQIDLSPALVSRHGVRPGHRPFEIVLAAESLKSGTKTAWFARNGYASPSEIRDAYAPAYQRLLEARVKVIEENAQIRLLEQPEYKRRWTLRDWDAELGDAARSALATAVEAVVAKTSVADTAPSLAAILARDERNRALAEHASTTPFDATIAELIAADAVPFCAAYRYTSSGLEKRAAWLATWDEQRKEDAGTRAPGPPIPVPPKYDSKDYASAIYWRLRGKLDVPKERFISYPGCESDEDKSPVYGWAGWNHLEQAQALAALYQKRKTEEGWGTERLVPMLAGLDELVPWIIQWHNEPSETFGGLRLGDYFRDFVAGQCRELGVTLEQVRAWRPSAGKKRSGKAKTEEHDAEIDSG